MTTAVWVNGGGRARWRVSRQAASRYGGAYGAGAVINGSVETLESYRAGGKRQAMGCGRGVSINSFKSSVAEIGWIWAHGKSAEKRLNSAIARADQQR